MPPPDPRPRRRWLPLVAGALALLAVGAGATVALAWYAVVRGRWAKTATAIFEPAPDSWPEEAPKSWMRPQTAMRSDRWGASDFTLSRPGLRYGEPPWNGTMPVPGTFVQHTAGWPLRAVEGSLCRGTGITGDRISALWRIPWGLKGAVDLPLRPMWPGFAVNTLAYAALAWGLWQIPVRLRRRWRIKRGRCAGCGYSLAGIGAASPCPECGAIRTSVPIAA